MPRFDHIDLLPLMMPATRTMNCQTGRENLLGMLPCDDVKSLIRQYMEDFPAALVEELQVVGAEIGARL